MCGLVAILSYADRRDPVDRDELIAIRDNMIPRGPDGHGLWISGDATIGLAHRRLSLLDLSTAGAQPMANSDNSLRIVFNGEIYNYLDLRQELEAKGYTFYSGSDTEVLLHLYDSKGEQMVDELRGMYAFVIWDDRRKVLFAARDPFGIKPLYLSDDGHSLRIASQVKALVAGGRIDTSREAAGQVGFLLLGYVPEPFTLYKLIQAFPAGACMTVEGATGKRSIRHFCSIRDEMARFEETTQGSEAKGMRLAFRASLTNSVRRHLIADVPVASFLSGGLDSATITALASQESSRKLHTVTLGFEEYRNTANDETACARGLADFYQTEHHTQWFSRAEFELELPEILNAMDQPSIDGINTYFVSKAARTLGVKTALSGLGGDELFGTYPSFRDVPRIVQLLRGNPITLAGSMIRKIASPACNRLASSKYAGILEYGGSFAGAYLLRRGLFMPWELPRFLPMETIREGWRTLSLLERLGETVAGIKSPWLKVSALEMTWYMRNQLLRDSDWAGMAHSIEIRLPLVDLDVFRRLAPLTAAQHDNGKAILGDLPTPCLPESVVHRPKTGFAVPVHHWLTGQQPRAKRNNLSSGLRSWATLLGREFKLVA